MSKTIGQFTYDVVKMGKGDLLPFDPWVKFTLKGWFTDEKSNAPLVSPQMMTEGEIDEHIGHLKADLDAVGRSAKAALRKAQEDTKALVSERVRERS